MNHLKQQVGDTLVEVTFAAVILSAVLVSCFALANLAYRQGARAQERAQAANLAQEQYEALRTVRDSNPWDAVNGFANQITTVTSGTTTCSDGTSGKCFYLYKDITNGGKWALASGSYAPTQGGSSAPGVQRVSIKVDNTVTAADGTTAYKVFGITAAWDPRGGSGPKELVEMKVVLANKDGLEPR